MVQCGHRDTWDGDCRRLLGVQQSERNEKRSDCSNSSSSSSGMSEVSDGSVLRSSLLFWFTDTLTIGAKKKLDINDLPPLPAGFLSNECQLEFLHANEKNKKESDPSLGDDWLQHLRAAADTAAVRGTTPLLRVLLRCYGSSLIKIGGLKLFITGLSFSGPLLIGAIVKYLEEQSIRSLVGGMVLVAVLAATSFLNAVANTNYNIRSTAIKLQMQSALTRVLFNRCLRLPTIAWRDLHLSNAESYAANLIQVDVERIANAAKSIHDLWSLPLLVLIAFALLYYNIKVAFLAGVMVIIILIPLNAMIAKRIGIATDRLMVSKDSRMKTITEALRNCTSLKMTSMEFIVLDVAEKHRQRELKYLSQQKYLDSLCVFLWATTPAIVPFITFMTTELLNIELTASDVITAIALLNMLIFPMNALPWMINGLMEARVSLRRLARVLSSRDGRYVHIPADILHHRDDGCNVEDDHKIATFEMEGTLWTWAKHSEVSQLAVLQDVVAGAVKDINGPINHEEEQLMFDPHGGQASTAREDVVPFNVSMNSIQLECGQMLGIVGPTGSGKSTALLGIVGELRSMAMDSDSRCSSITGASYQCSFSYKANSDADKGILQLLQQRNSASQKSQEQQTRPSLISYCPQLPIIMSGSVRSNILMGSAYHPLRYQEVLEGCGLTRDLEESQNWPHGDQSDVGVGGSKLSGGQKLRIGVARAVYAYNCPVVLLDDPFAALDADTGRLLMSFLIGTVVTRDRRIVILCTHAVNLIKYAATFNRTDKSEGNAANEETTSNESIGSVAVLFLERGKEIARGGYDEMLSKCKKFRDFNAEQCDKLSSNVPLHQQLERHDESVRSIEETTEVDSDIVRESELGVSLANATGAVVEQQQDNEEDEDNADYLEHSATGRIARDVYLSYFAAVGVCLTISIILSTLLMQAFAIAMSFWFAYWATHQHFYSRKEFIFITSMILCGTLVFALLRSFLFAMGGLAAAKRLYASLASAVFHSEVDFFELNAIGRISNRFGKDTNTIDDSLPFIMNILLAQSFLLLGSTFVMGFNDPPIVLLLLIVAIFYYRLQKFYRRSSRELRRLDAVYKSPLYTVVMECLQVSATIRTLGSKCIHHYDRELQLVLDKAMRVTFAVELASQWLGIRLQLLGALITTVLAASLLLNNVYEIIPISAGLAGLSLIYSFTIVANLNGFLNSLSETEQEMVSVERVREYINGARNEYNEDDNDEDDTKDNRPICCCCCSYSLKQYQSIGHSNARMNQMSNTVSDEQQQQQLLNPLLDGDAQSGSTSASRFVYRLLTHNQGISSVGIELRDLCMRYKVHDHDTLQHLNLKINLGARVAIVGRTGSGKSSLLRMLLRLNDYTSGSALIGGVELRQIPKRRLRKCLSVIPQQPILFTGTIRFNLDPYDEYSDEEVAEALSLSRYHQSVRGHSEQESYTSASHGINDMIEDGGTLLSIGQQQLLCLARALLRKSDLILIDEAASAIDPITEQLLYDALLNYTQATKATMLMICHKLQGVERVCNKILRMQDGHIISYEDIN